MLEKAEKLFNKHETVQKTATKKFKMEKCQTMSALFEFNSKKSLKNFQTHKLEE